MEKTRYRPVQRTEPRVAAPGLAALGLAMLGLAMLGLAGCGGQGAPQPEEWRQWRGPGGLGVSAETGLPHAWGGDGTNIRWRVDVPGLGNSSPIVSNGRVVLTSAVEDPENPANLVRLALAYDLETGNQLWRTTLDSTPKETIHFLSTHAAATPAADDEHLFVYFGSFLAKLDQDGRKVWIKDVDPKFVNGTRYGVGSSPLLVGGLVVLFQDQETANRLDDTGWLAAFDQETGEMRWRHTWTDTCCAYSTPLAYDDGEILQVLVPFSGRVVSYEVATGESLWSQSYRIHQIVPSLALSGDLLCVTGGGHRVNGTACMRLVGRGRETVAEVLWETPRLAASMSSPVLYKDRLYVLTQNGILVQYQPDTGEINWKNRLSRGHCHASLVAGDDKVYAVSNRGPVAVVAAEDEYRLLSENTYEGGLSATPAIAGGCLLFRSKRSLYCVAEGEGPQEGPGIGPAKEPAEDLEADPEEEPAEEA
jgi:outer membrane protein assembly factor BamB